MPAKIPFLAPSTYLQEKWAEAQSSNRVKAQIFVFTLLLSIGFIRQYLYPTKKVVHVDRTTGVKEETIAQIDSLIVYPIKSCSGVRLDAASLGSKGFELDRRWMIVKISPDGTAEKVSLREDRRLTLIIPEVDEERGMLHLTLSEHAETKQPRIATPLRPSKGVLEGWKSLSNVEMWSDFADGRIAESSNSNDPSPSEWISSFLGYDALLLHFDPHSAVQRTTYPIFKPPADYDTWPASEQQELSRRCGLEFQDIYPLLVASRESLQFVQEQIHDAVQGSRTGQGDGRGGRAIGGLDASLWDKSTGTNTLNIERFRPNVVLRSRDGSTIAPFSEDSWERIWIKPSEEGSASVLQLVARCERCRLTAVDPVTAEADVSVPIKFLSRSRTRNTYKITDLSGRPKTGPCFGMYAVPLQLAEKGYGSIKVGDEVRVRWRPYALDDEPTRQKHEWTKHGRDP